MAKHLEQAHILHFATDPTTPYSLMVNSFPSVCTFLTPVTLSLLTL